MEQTSSFKSIVSYLFKQLNLKYLSLPPLLVLLLGYLIVQGYYAPEKALLEYAGLATISVFMVITLINYLRDKNFFTLGCAGLIFALLSREIHYTGSDVLIYATVLLIAWLVVKNFTTIRPYIDQPPYFSILVTGFFVYFISQTTDQRWWRWVPYEDIVHVPLEETLEIIGHLFVGTALSLWQRTE